MLSGSHSRLARAGWRAFVVLVAVASAACDKMPLTAPTSSTIALVAGTLTLPTGGTTQLTATVLESSGTPVQNGTTVRFTSTLGTVSPAEVETHNGIAVATFTAGTQSGTAEIRATSGNATGGSTGTTGTGTGTTATPATTGGAGAAVSITIGAANVNTVVVSASPSNVPSTGGSVTLIATALDTNGNRLVGVPVTFSTTAGTLSSTVAITDANGEARVTLTTNRTATVTAAAGSKTSTATTVNVSAPNGISLTVAPTSAAINTPVTLTVTPTVGTNNVAPTVTVDWGDGTTSDLGTVATARTVTHIYKTPGIYTITATAKSEGGESTQSSIPVTITAQAPLGVTIAASPANPAAGDLVTFTATITGDLTAVATQYAWTVTSNTASESGTFTTTSPQLQIAFGTAGIKNVSVTVTTTTNKTATGQTQVRVQ